MDNISRYKKETRRKGREKCRPYIENRYNAKNALRSGITKISRKIMTRKIEKSRKVWTRKTRKNYLHQNFWKVLEKILKIFLEQGKLS